MSEREELERAFIVAFPEPPRSWRPMPIEQAIVDPMQSVAVRKHTDWRHNVRGRFYRLLDAEAYLDAAMMLVPDDMRDELEITTLYQVARVGINLNHGPDSGPFYGEDLGNSIPLALCRAALKARETVK